MVKSNKASLAIEVHAPKTEVERLGSSIRLSEVLSSDLRLDASAYGVAARNAIAALKASGLPLIPLFGPEGFSQEAHNAFRFKRIYVRPEQGVPFLSSSEIISMRPRADRFISRTLTPKLTDLIIKKWDVMISCSGTVGNVGLAGDTFADKALSQDAIRVRTSHAETAGYIAAFLRSHYGRPQLREATYGSVIGHIEPHHLQRILVPDLPPIRRIAIGELMCQATELRDKANTLLDEADRLLCESLRLSPLDKSFHEGSRISKIRVSDLTDRFDSSFHDPLVRIVVTILNGLTMPVTTMGDKRVTRIIRGVTKFRKRVYVERGGIPLLNSKQVFQIDPVDIKHLAKGAHTKDLPEIQLRENMILVSSSGTIGRAQIVPKYMSTWAANEHLHRVVPADEMHPGYLYAWLASDYGKCLIQRYSYGSVISEIDSDMLRSAPVPLADETIRNVIGELVLKANILRDEAWRREQDAIQQIESLVENVSFDLSSQQGTSSEVFLVNLEPGFEVRHPIPVSIVKVQNNVVASFVAANVHASGDTQDEAVSHLKSLLIDMFELLLTHSPEELGPAPSRQLSVLQSYIRSAEDAHQRTRP
jgi:type I restriction enzyme, S subunit